ncbi:hypothetical protein [Polaromonas sp.]|uniref:hypothetical protein n=1 Tax=Polaromonas sp. TaxID=1869339 RepID=UPI0017DAE26C|nr:hypothetical protein [Polaromonas sp.]NML84709.1 hypothetical protein [Polaromonas sp.]
MKNLHPQEAWTSLHARFDTRFVDRRLEIESLFGGRPLGVVSVPRYEYPDLQPEAQRFAELVARGATSKQPPVLLICRSGCCWLDAGLAL